MQGPIVSLKDRIHKSDPSSVFLHCSSGLQNPTSPGAHPQHPPLFLGHLHDPLHPSPPLCRWWHPVTQRVCPSFPFLLSGGGDRRPWSWKKLVPPTPVGPQLLPRQLTGGPKSVSNVLLTLCSFPQPLHLAQKTWPRAGQQDCLPILTAWFACLWRQRTCIWITVISCTSFNLSSLVICKIRELIPLASHSCWEAQTSGTLKRLAGNKRSAEQGRGSLSDIEQPPRSGVGTTCTCKERQDLCRLRFCSLKQTFKWNMI